TSTMNRLAPTEVELEIPITPEELAAAEERAFRKLAKNVRLPGFRAGKVPRKVFEQTYGSDAITSQAMDEVVPEVYAKAVREHELDPVERPKMEVLEESGGRPTRLRAVVQVRPAIELRPYKGIEVASQAETVGEGDVDRSLAALAKERAMLVPVDRAAELGDVVTIDYRGTIDGEPFEGGSAESQVTELVEARFIPGFAAGIAGMRPGESREIEARFPDDYAETSLAGKGAVFAVTLHDVKQFDLPAIDDEFAKAISDNATLEELRGDVRRRLETIAQARARRAVGNAVMERLLAEHEFPLPPALVESELDQLVNDAASAAARAGTNFEAYLEASGKTQDGLREEYRPEAESRVKGTLLIESIAKAEKIAATPADINDELASLARQYGQPVARIQKALGNNLLSLMDGIVRNKTLDFLIDNAKVVAREETSRPLA
ncbi:MAG TPA: trigger factor, partial [Verrucomicrobiae bacterium]|nr:trigger factor [Verrucomicrobiae bacterium]